MNLDWKYIISFVFLQIVRFLPGWVNYFWNNKYKPNDNQQILINVAAEYNRVYTMKTFDYGHYLAVRKSKANPEPLYYGEIWHTECRNLQDLNIFRLVKEDKDFSSYELTHYGLSYKTKP